MNARQLSFFRQAQSDWDVFLNLHLGALSLPRCHALHYLQMCTEKLAKAYFAVPPRGHAAFRALLKAMLVNPAVLAPLGFADLAAFSLWAGSSMVLVGAIEDLAPSIADKKHLPNPEYPWPLGAEVHAPRDYLFQVDIFDLVDAQLASGQPSFLDTIDQMVATMQAASWHL